MVNFLQDFATGQTGTKFGQPAPSTYSAPTGQATTQQVASTGAVAPAAENTAPAPWTIQGGSFTENDWDWRDGAEREYSQWGGDGSPTVTQEKQDAGWYLSEAAKQRMGSWGTDNWANVSWEGGLNPRQHSIDRNDAKFWEGRTYGGGGDGDGGYQGVFNQGAYDQAVADLKAKNPLLEGNFTGKIKTGAKEGTTYQWNGLDVGQGSRSSRWDTNNGDMNKKALMAFAALASMGLAAPAVLGAQAVGGGVLGSGLTMGQIGFGTNFANMVTGGRIPGLKEAGMVTGLAGGVGSLADTFTNGINSAGDAFNLAKTGYGVYNKGSQLMDTFNPQQPPPRPQGTTDAGYGYANGPEFARESHQGPGTGVYANGMPGENNFDLGSIIRGITGRAGGGGTGLLDIYGAYRGTQEARDEAERLKKMYEEAQGRRQPVLDRLNESYTNPDSFYDSNQWKGLSSVYQNSIDRGAAKTGRMANPTDREVLMQQHAMKGMQDYRSGLQQQLTALNPDAYINPYMRGSTREAGSFNPIGALGGRGSVGGPGQQGGASGLEGLIRMIQQGGGAAAGGIQNLIRQLTGGGGGNYNPGAQAPGTEYQGSDEVPVGGLETQYGDPQISYGDDWGTAFNPDGGNGFGYGDFDVADTSWIDDFSFDF